MPTLKEQLLQKINSKTKPLGALGRLEEIALQVGMIQNSLSPVILSPHLLVFAGDHGIAATGLVNPYPQAVTAQMVVNFLHGGAAINVFCLQNHIRLIVVDAGVNHDFNDLASEDFISAKIGWGTRNYLEEPAMTEDEAGKAMEKGKEIVNRIHAKNCNCIGFGEMGIGNTSAAALIMSAVTGLEVEECTGRGTGADEAQLETKIKTVKKVHDIHQLSKLRNQPTRLLSKVGGFEIAMMAGAFLKAAELNMVIVVDGFIATSALLISRAFEDRVLENCIFAHTSGERGHEKMLAFLGVRPLLNLGMRLGEGTGAALAIPLIQSAVIFLEKMASFESAGVSKKN